MKLGLFPLPLFLLPGGITRLRVFEPRYVRLVQESAGNEGFVIASAFMSFEPADEQANWGSWVKIIDFSMGDDGLLLIDVQCGSLVTISSFDIEDDGLKRGDVIPFAHWIEPGKQFDTPQSQAMCDALKQVFEQQEQLQSLYAETHFDSLLWTSQRWAELLPLKPAEQNSFVKPDSFPAFYEFAKNIILE